MRDKISLDDFITLQRGFDLPRRKRKNGKIPIVASSGIIDDHSEAKVEGPGVVIGRSGSIGGGQFIKEDFWPLNTTLWVRDFKENNPRFVYYMLKSINFQRFNAGAGVPTLNRNHLSAIKVPKYNINTQIEIASILSSYDKLIENNRRRIELLEKSAKLLYKEWFVHLRFPGHEHTNITDGVPEGWERIKFGELIDVNKGKNITKKKAIPGNIPVVAGGLEPSYYHNEPNVDGPVVTVSASGANAGYVNLYHSDIWSSDSSYIKAKDDKTTYFLYSMLKAKQKHIFGMQRGAAQPHVYPKDLNRLEVVVSPENFKSLAEEYIEPNFIQIEKLKKLNDNLRKARDLLIPKLMNGDITV